MRYSDKIRRGIERWWDTVDVFVCMTPRPPDHQDPEQINILADAILEELRDIPPIDSLPHADSDSLGDQICVAHFADGYSCAQIADALEAAGY